MDIFERFNSRFGKWYEGLFGEGGGELRPKDVLRKLTAAMEDNRKEGLDGKIYVPNKYVLELAVSDADERDYLLSFLDEEELVAVLQKFMAQNNYNTRGPLDFTIAEVPEAARETRPEKLRVKVRYERGDAPTPSPSPADGRGEPDKVLLSSFLPPSLIPMGEGPGVGAADNLPTVASVYPNEDDEPGTVPAVAWAALDVTSPEGKKSHFPLTKPAIQIGRSRNAENDLILDTDSMVSKAHAQLERERDGQWTLYDLGSTNGVKVGAVRVDGNRALSDGDEIVIGATTLVFHKAGQPAAAQNAVPQSAASPVPPPPPSSAPPRRARLIGPDGEAFVLASETLIGRAVTSDIILSDPSVATKHARVIAPDAATYLLEDLSGLSETRVNDRILFSGQRLLLTNGDILSFGSVQMRFATGTAA